MTGFCAASRAVGKRFAHRLEADFGSILRLARDIDQDEERVRDWYLSVTIHELGGKTAQELVQMGQAHRVIGFLRSIGRGYRD